MARFGLALYGSLGVFLRNFLRVGMLVSMEDQCFLTILNAFLALGQNWVINVGLGTSLLVVTGLLFLFLAFPISAALMVNFIFLSCLLIKASEYPLLIRFHLCCNRMLE